LIGIVTAFHVCVQSRLWLSDVGSPTKTSPSQADRTSDREALALVIIGGVFCDPKLLRHLYKLLE